MMSLKKIVFISSFVFCNYSIASDSWYKVNNFECMIGKYPIHMSIQTYNFGYGINIEGSYYYDNHRSPIVLYGIKTNNSLKLCEISGGSDFERFIVSGEGYNPNSCPFQLTKNGNELNGSWVSNNKKFNVILASTSKMDELSIKSKNNSIEIPFWGQTKMHSFNGVYQKTSNGLSINKINVINKKDGGVIQVINPQSDGCEFGFYMTSIFQNLERVSESTILLNCYSTKADVSVEYNLNKDSAKYEKIAN